MCCFTISFTFLPLSLDLLVIGGPAKAATYIDMLQELFGPTLKNTFRPLCKSIQYAGMPGCLKA